MNNLPRIHNLFTAFTVLLVITFLCCNSPTQVDKKNSNNISQKTIDSSRLKYLRDMALADSARKKFLTKIDEVEIKDKTVESYRLGWDRSFHGPISYTIEMKKDNSSLKVVYPKKMKDIDTLDENVIIKGSFGDEIILLSQKISKEDWNDFKNLLNSSNFWELDEGLREGDGWYDGSYWTIEGKLPATDSTEEKYHHVTRFSPDTGKFRNACLKLIKLGPKIDEEYIY